MSYAIIQFTCTKLGDAAIKDYEDENTHELTADEIKALWLISQYQLLKNSNAKKTIHSVETDFQKLYLSVNLTRLVAMKLISFNPKAQEKPVEKEKKSSDSQRAMSTRKNSTSQKNVGRNVNDFIKSAVNSPAGNNLPNKATPNQIITNKTKADTPVTVNIKKKPDKVENLSNIDPSILLAAGRY